jgi:uncharacterized protein DUF6339
MNLTFLSREATDRLDHRVGDNLVSYQSGNTQNLIKDADFRLSRIETVPPPDLLEQNGDVKADLEASKLVFQWLSKLTPIQSSDGRLWTLLTHTTFARYVSLRWGQNLESSQRPVDRIHDRWFFRGQGIATFVRNGISRLWWFGYLTYDSNRANPFELTEALLSLQDIQVAFLERSLGRCRPLLKAVLESVISNDQILRQTPKRGDVIQEWAKELRLFGGAYLLDAMPQDRLQFVVESKLKSRLVEAK